MSLRREVDEIKNKNEREESPLDPVIYEEASGTSSALSILTPSPHQTAAVFPFILPLEGDKTVLRGDQSCSLHNIWGIIVRAFIESVVFGAIFLVPAIVVFFTTESSWYNLITKRWDRQYELFTPVMEFVRISFHTAVLYALWVMIDAGTRVVPLIVRRSWHLLAIPLPNAVKTTLAGWKAARKSVNLALFGFLGLFLTDLIVFGSSKLVSSASEWTMSTIGGFSKANQYAEKILIASVSLSILLLGKKVVIQWITNSYRKQALAPRILASNFKFRVLTRLFRQTNLGETDARRSLIREQAREALHPADEDFIEISKDIAGIHLTSQSRAEYIARALWSRVCPFSRDYLVREDLRPFFTAEDTPEAFAVFDLNSTGIVTERLWIDAVIEIWRERRNLQSSVRMSDAALGGFEAIVNAFIYSCWVMAFMSCISSSGYMFLVSSSGFILGFGFLFKDTCERIFKSFIFVLVVHPFDIGDTIVIDKTRYTVMEMQIFQTTFKKLSDSTVTYISNNVLLGKYIYNENRSGLTTESLLVTLPANTAVSVLGALQNRLNVFLSETFSSYTGALKISPIEAQNGKMNIRVECKFRDSVGLENEVKIDRKDSLSQQIQTYLREKGINVG